MGDVLGGIFGSGGSQSGTTTPDPTSQALNSLRLQQLQSLFTAAPYSNFAQPATSGAYAATPAVQQLFNTATDVKPPIDYSNLMSFEDYKKLGLDASQNYIKQIAEPEIMSTLALQGLEGGGAAPAAIAKASAQYALPFVTSLPQASTSLTLARPQAELTRAQAGLTGAQQASTLFPLADYSRNLQEQDLLRRQGVVTSGLTGLPFNPGSSTDQSKSSQPLFNFFGQG